MLDLVFANLKVRPIRTLISVVGVAVIAAVVAALYPAFKASRMNVLEAIATE